MEIIMGVSCSVHLVTKSARLLRDDNDVDTEIGPKVTFKNLLLKVLSFAVRQKKKLVQLLTNVFLSEESFLTLFP